jgi:hypothetical protein
MRGQPKKADPRKNQMRMMLNDKEKAMFDRSGFSQTHLLREWLLHVIRTHENKKDLIDHLYRQITP